MDKVGATMAVRQCGMALQGLPEVMKQDKEVVMVAVQQDGMALEYGINMQPRT